jgi:hypothetical protein
MTQKPTQLTATSASIPIHNENISTTNSELMHGVMCKKEEANTKNAYPDLELCRAMNGPQVLDNVITKLLM